MTFSQRIGKRPVRTALQIEDIDDDLRNRLWNTVLEKFFDKLKNFAAYGEESQKGSIAKLIWKEFYKLPIDKIPSYAGPNVVNLMGFVDFVRQKFFAAQWYDVYDFIEFIALLESKIINVGFIKACNIALETEVSGYRIVNEKVVQITTEEEIRAIEEATVNTDKWQSVNTHLQTALDDIADRKNPNYRNSIKESISAVESFCKIITKNDKATLGEALKEIEKKHKIHNALKIAFSAIYGYTSDSGGIRHALLESDVQVEFEDAKFMLVSCSAFINYLKTKIKI